MPEYIEREAEYLKKTAVIDNVIDQLRHSKSEVAMRERLLNLEAADVRPVVRGRWKMQGGGFVKCTSCMTLMFNADTPHEWNYCPNCGAAIMEES